MGREYKRDPKGYRKSHGIQEPVSTRTTIFAKYKTLTITLDIVSIIFVGILLGCFTWCLFDRNVMTTHGIPGQTPFELKLFVTGISPGVFGLCWLIAHFVAKVEEGEDKRSAIYDYRLQPFLLGLPVFCLFIYVYMYCHLHLLRE